MELVKECAAVLVNFSRAKYNKILKPLKSVLQWIKVISKHHRLNFMFNIFFLLESTS